LSVMPDYLNMIFNRAEALGLTLDITWYRLQLGAYDAVTGWPAKSYVGSTVRAAVFDRSTSPAVYGLGFYPKLDGVAFCDTLFREGDILVNPQGTAYKIMGVLVHAVGDKVVYYEYSLVHSYLVASVIVPPLVDEYGFEWVVVDVTGFDDEFERSTSPL
jgi:hypothetical protein